MKLSGGMGGGKHKRNQIDYEGGRKMKKGYCLDCHHHKIKGHGGMLPPKCARCGSTNVEQER